MTLVDVAMHYVGVKSGSRTHAQIVDLYNTIKPLPRGYKLQYSDAWCMAFVSICQLKAGVTDPIYECSCWYAYNIAKQRAHVLAKPTPGALVFYDWDGNRNTLEHVGIIARIDNGMMSVVEGNYSRAVKVRKIPIGDKRIAGFAWVDKPQADIAQLANDVLAGKYGNGKERKQKLGKHYDSVQNLVNALLANK